MPASPIHTVPRLALGRIEAVAIGSSTGGPQLVEQILTRLPAYLPFPIFLAQHLPPSFSRTFANFLAHRAALAVFHAEDGMPVLPGTVYVGVGHQHLRVRRAAGTARPVLEVSPQPQTLPYKPAADELFRSTAAIYGRHTLAIVLSGIGRDGTEGARAVQSAGGIVISQNAETCAVYGMPRACFEAGLSNAVLDPECIRQTILQLSPGHGGGRAFPAAVEPARGTCAE